ncbi:GNAT family N-acetyltransferase [Vibrio maerlii]|uniref:GNAT family N-acetyltransferase n=1 Tax=Vibrio maerlii TaxID=2231648 RepID=UPI000E3D5A4D|nr:N-acetyltransferase [Vibrio maerlii]
MNYQMYKAEQLEELKRLFTQTFSDSEGVDEGKVLGELVESLVATTPKTDIRVFVAMDGNKMAGAILFTHLTFESDKTAFLLAPVAVLTEYQGKGVGQALIKHGLEAMRAEGVSLAFTYGDPQYYTRVGFERITEEQFKAPQKLSYPHGWLAQSLTEEPLTAIAGGSECVEGFNKPELW